jgi:hypothetical protein
VLLSRFASKNNNRIFLWVKDYNKTENTIDVSDKDNAVVFYTWKVKELYACAIASYSVNGTSTHYSQ